MTEGGEVGMRGLELWFLVEKIVKLTLVYFGSCFSRC